MWTYRPPNLIVAALYLVGGLAIAACFLTTCYPSHMSQISRSVSGAEFGVLIVLLLVGLVAVTIFSNAFRVVMQLAGQLLQIAVVIGVIWGGVVLYRNHDQYKVRSVPPATYEPYVPPEPTKEPPPPEPSGAWWQDNPYEEGR